MHTVRISAETKLLLSSVPPILFRNKYLKPRLPAATFFFVSLFLSADHWNQKPELLSVVKNSVRSNNNNPILSNRQICYAIEKIYVTRYGCRMWAQCFRAASRTLSIKLFLPTTKPVNKLGDSSKGQGRS